MAPLTTRRQRRFTALALTLLPAWVVVATEPGSPLGRWIDLERESVAPATGFAPIIGATMVDSLPTSGPGGFDVDNDGKADGGERRGAKLPPRYGVWKSLAILIVWAQRAGCSSTLEG